MCIFCFLQFILLDLITLMMCDVWYRLLNFLLCTFLRRFAIRMPSYSQVPYFRMNQINRLRIIKRFQTLHNLE
jgi:hypothetical protein